MALINELEKRLDAQEQIIAQLVMSQAEIAQGMEMLMATFLQGMTDDEAKAFMDNMNKGRQEMFDYMARLVRDGGVDRGDPVAAAAVAEMDKRMSASDHTEDS